MNQSNKWVVSVVLNGLLLTGCVSKITEKEQYSGFLPNYGGLQEVASPTGVKVLRWQAPGFKPASYSTVVFEKLELYPAPKPNERVNLKTLQELQAYTSNSAREALSQNYQVVSSIKDVRDGARALVLRAAITGVTATNEGMKWYEVVPVAAVVGATQAATGHRDQNTELYIEADLVDVSTGMPIAKAVRKVFGKELKNASQPITANDFKAAIQGMTHDMKMILR
ncbi:Protein of unknown function [Pseudomonas sp. LAMO17WK12:I10]|uniref:DUF3313 domain-containing protein n=1 Tax=unclassified Pseudomonas TaxID=196821 RepID=UPI000BDD2CBA|nr:MULTISPECIES: DUF3313 domain-containing protein [unclassified Pseudomonas]PXX51566.1 uncharacterized protein DUF3313 [Pseudomonas sp. LAMO17WK12:I9]SNY53718.1 Protein of unknown function [Pseudomonas sp. LAMO17WK12:I10]